MCISRSGPGFGTRPAVVFGKRPFLNSDSRNQSNSRGIPRRNAPLPGLRRLNRHARRTILATPKEQDVLSHPNNLSYRRRSGLSPPARCLWPSVRTGRKARACGAWRSIDLFGHDPAAPVRSFLSADGPRPDQNQGTDFFESRFKIAPRVGCSRIRLVRIHDQAGRGPALHTRDLQISAWRLLPESCSGSLSFGRQTASADEFSIPLYSESQNEFRGSL